MKQLIVEIAMAIALAVAVIYLICGCSKSHIEFRATPPPPNPVARLLGEEPVTRRTTSAGWEMVSVLEPVNEVPMLLLPSTPPTLKWQANPGFYRLLVSNGSNGWTEHSLTVVFARAPSNDATYLLVPTNRFKMLVSP